jgi:hypothetical protein
LLNGPLPAKPACAVEQSDSEAVKPTTVVSKALLRGDHASTSSLLRLDRASSAISSRITPYWSSFHIG